MELLVSIISGLLLAWLIITRLAGGQRSRLTTIRNFARHGISNPEGMSDAAIIEHWQRCRRPGCRDCKEAAFVRELYIERGNSEGEGE